MEYGHLMYVGGCYPLEGLPIAALHVEMFVCLLSLRSRQDIRVVLLFVAAI